MTAKQQRFVDEYLIDLNATQAAIRAGYSAKTAEQTASRLLSFVKVREAIAEVTESVRSDRVATANEVMSYLTTVMRNDGEKTCDRLRATELLGKRYGLFTDKLDMNAPVTLVFADDYGD